MGSGFSLDPAAPMSEAVRRVALAEIDTAYAALASPPERHKGVHDSRKCLKRLRSLLVLIKPGLPEPVFLSLTERLRTIARGLAPARDAAALLDAVDKFAKAEGEGEATPIPALRSWLQERRQAAKHSLDGSTAADAMRGLFALRPAMANLAVYPDDFSSIAKGLRDSYRGGRKAFARAFATGNDEDFHEWRKTLQHHWRHMQLVSAAWPEFFDARVVTARNLSQILGEVHDLAVLQKFLESATDARLTKRQRDIVFEVAASRQSDLRQDAYALAHRLFAEPPGAFRDHVVVYWQAARDEPPAALAAE